MDDALKKLMDAVQTSAAQGRGHLQAKLTDVTANNEHVASEHGFMLPPGAEVLGRLRALMQWQFPEAELLFQLQVQSDYASMVEQMGSDEMEAAANRARLLAGMPGGVAGNGKPALFVPDGNL